MPDVVELLLGRLIIDSFYILGSLLMQRRVKQMAQSIPQLIRTEAQQFPSNDVWPRAFPTELRWLEPRA